jgi:single-stranded DNA-binding protein
VRLTGKLSRIGSLKYTPSGLPLREATLAVVQDVLGKSSVGYHDLLFHGDVAEKSVGSLKIGVSMSVVGELWQRSFKNRKGTKVSETKVVVSAVEPPQFGTDK